MVAGYRVAGFRIGSKVTVAEEFLLVEVEVKQNQFAVKFWPVLVIKINSKRTVSAVEILSFGPQGCEQSRKDWTRARLV